MGDIFRWEWSKSINVAEIQERAEREILKFVQWLSFQEEGNRLKGGANTSKVKGQRVAWTMKKWSAVYTLDPVMKKGLMWVGGRLNKAPISNKARNAIIL